MSNSRLDHLPVAQTAPCPLDPLDAMRQFDTCTIANTIEKFRGRLRNQGYTRPGSGVRHRWVLASVGVCSDLPGPLLRPVKFLSGLHGLVDRDRADSRGSRDSGPGSRKWRRVVGRRSSCRHPEGVSLRGRDYQRSRARYPRGPENAVSHVRPIGGPLPLLFPRGGIFGLKIRAGDLLYADYHGVGSIAHEIAAAIPEAAMKIRAHEQSIIEVCQSPDFSAERHRLAIRNSS